MIYHELTDYINVMQPEDNLYSLVDHTEIPICMVQETMDILGCVAIYSTWSELDHDSTSEEVRHVGAITQLIN